jgi:hypothetical protein
MSLCFPDIAPVSCFPLLTLLVVSFVRHSCITEPCFLMTLLHSGCARRLLPNVNPFWVPCTTLSWPCPLRRALQHGVFPLRAAANFFRDPPLPWVRSFGFPRLDAGPYAASSVLQKISLWPIPKRPPHATPRTSSLLDLPPSFLDRHPT